MRKRRLRRKFAACHPDLPSVPPLRSEGHPGGKQSRVPVSLGDSPRGSLGRPFSESTALDSYMRRSSSVSHLIVSVAVGGLADSRRRRRHLARGTALQDDKLDAAIVSAGRLVLVGGD